MENVATGLLRNEKCGSQYGTNVEARATQVIPNNHSNLYHMQWIYLLTASAILLVVYHVGSEETTRSVRYFGIGL